MMSPRRLEPAIAVCLVVLLAAACTAEDAAEPSPEDAAAARCEAVVRRFVDGLQSYVDGFSGMTPQQYAVEGDPAALEELQRLVRQRRATWARQGCDTALVDQRLQDGLDRLSSDGAVAAAVADGFRDHLRHGTGHEPRRIQVGPDDDLAVVAATAPAGSTLALSAGTHRLDDTVVVPRPLTIVGAGRDDTRLVSAAPEIAVLVPETGAIDLQRLAVESTANVAAVVAVHTSWYRLRDLRIVGAGEADDEGVDVGLLLQPTRVGPEPPELPGIAGSASVFDRTVQRVEIVDSAGGGLAVAGRARPRIVGADLRGNDVCGICYLGSAGGSLLDSDIVANEVGVVVSGTADPTVAGNRLTDNTMQALVVDGHAAGTFEDNEIHGNGEQAVVVTDDVTVRLVGNRFADNGEVAIALAGRSDASLEANEVVGHDIGVWVDGDATATFVRHGSAGVGTVGVVLAGASRAEFTGSTIEGYGVGLEVREGAAGRLTDLTLVGSEEAGLVLRDDAAVEGAGLRCDENSFDVVLLDGSSYELEPSACEVHDER